MFTEIKMIAYDRPLSQRVQSRRICGPYSWRPTKAPNVGRGFYQAGDGLACDPRGSTFDLRLEPANEHLPSYSRAGRILGYWCDQEGYGDTYKPIIARLPRGRGFLAGWTMGEGMCAALDSHIWPDAREAALAAHDLAETDAEHEREYRAEELDPDSMPDDGEPLTL